MLPTLQKRSPLLQPGGSGRLFIALATGLLGLSAAGVEYRIANIAEETRINRNPAISDTGLIAWRSSLPERGGVDRSAIVIYSGGTRRVISDDLGYELAGHMPPQLSGNTVVWQADLPPAKESNDWLLADVPQAEGAPPVVEARFEFKIEPREDGIADPNFFPEQQSWVRPDDTRPEGAEEGSEAKPRISAQIRGGGANEIVQWRDGAVTRITADSSNDLGPAVGGDLVAWQRARGWPFGWEIVLWNGQQFSQLTTNFYYDMGARIHNDQVVWYGWDGNDFEIFLFDNASQRTTQITTNDYDDVSPVIWDGVIAWEAYEAVEANIHLYKDGAIRAISSNIEDDINPRIWNGQVVWQGFDGDDYEIYHFDGERTIKLTSNDYDDVNPDIQDDVIVWMGYHDNWDSEIFVHDAGGEIKRLTDNEYDDRSPKTAGGRIVWHADDIDKSYIFLAEPK